MPANRITLAAVAGAHGIAGELRLKLFAESLDSLKHHEVVEIDGKAFALEAVRAGGQGAIVRLSGIASRDAAEALRGTLLTVARSSLPPLGEGEYYHADIIGMNCVAADGAPLGTVIAIENYGAGDILEIERPAGGRVLVPFRPPAADLRGERIVVGPEFLA